MIFPTRSKYQIFEVSGSDNQQGSETLRIGYLDPQGMKLQENLQEMMLACMKLPGLPRF